MAVAVFTVVLGAAAQALISYHNAMEIQHQRTQALQSCQSTLAAMRQARDASPGDLQNSVIANWPAGQDLPGIGGLNNEVVRVTYADPNANPLTVTVTCQWTDLANRQTQVALTSLITDS
jgi:type II secretory pathway pseudopilin PulG